MTGESSQAPLLDSGDGAAQAPTDGDRRFRKIFDHSNDAIFVIDPELDEILDANPRACRLLGYPREELLEAPVSAVHPDEMPALRAFAASVFDRGAGWTNELTCTTKAGQCVPAEISASVFEIGGRPYLLALVRDITERKRAEDALREAHAELARRVAELQELERRMADRTAELEAFSYSISHDLQTPLRAIEGFSRMLQRDYGAALDGEGRRLVHVISRNAQTMGQLIDGLLAFSRLGRQDIHPATIDMTELARSAFEEVVAGREATRPEFHLNPLPPARGDAIMLRQVLVNLIANAVKFTLRQETAVIRMGADPAGADCVYYVRDNGVGFDMAYAHKLFGVFQRLHHGDEFEGTGVGLAIVHQIVRRHGGRVWAESAPGQGATFFFTLPEEPHSS